MTHTTNKEAGGTDPILSLAAMEERLKAVEEYLGIIVGSANFTLPKASPEIASLVQEIQKNPLNAMCDNEGQTESPLKKSDKPTPEGLLISPIKGIIPFDWASARSSFQGPAICPDTTGEGSAWQGVPAPAEPAPGSDAEHPPIGYRLAKVGEKREKGYIYFYDGKWRRDYPVDSRVGGAYRATDLPVANPIPPAEIDRDPRDAEIAEHRATVERLTVELDKMKRRLADLLADLGKMIAEVRG